TEIVGREGDTITLQDVFLFEETGLDGNGRIQGKLSPTGIRPNAMAKIYSRKVAISPELAALFPDRKAPDYTLGVRRCSSNSRSSSMGRLCATSPPTCEASSIGWRDNWASSPGSPRARVPAGT